MSVVDIIGIKEAALKEINKEKSEKAKNAIVKKLRQLDDAKAIVSNIEREITDLESSIVEGSFNG